MIIGGFFSVLQSTGAVVTESQTYKKRADFLSNDDYAVYVRENIQVSLAVNSPLNGAVSCLQGVMMLRVEIQ